MTVYNREGADAELANARWRQAIPMSPNQSEVARAIEHLKTARAILEPVYKAKYEEAMNLYRKIEAHELPSKSYDEEAWDAAIALEEQMTLIVDIEGKLEVAV